jgi:type III restriction enzyme
MAGAVFEAQFQGADDYNFDADHGAVVIWFSDAPSLNEQTRFRLMEASGRLNHTDLVPIVETRRVILRFWFDCWNWSRPAESLNKAL